ncbi:hypothetical protein TH61_11455 [Rufibacter sp. DG15C]|nr:hypothetical protein TH61_11455 [Rufibacter sp. DG15C]
MILVALFWIHQVDQDITERDKVTITKILQENNIIPLSGPDKNDFHEQIKFISAVQKAVLLTAPRNKGLDEGMSREPEVLYKMRYGHCYDRSRAIEKILRLSGFKTRHVSVYSLDENSALHAFLKPKTRSHALSEVLTVKGWVFVDSNDKLIGVDKFGNPIDLTQVKKLGFKNIVWSKYNTENFDGVYATKFMYVYGLYSRHGKFYPPYNFIPDLHWGELVYNFGL